MDSWGQHVASHALMAPMDWAVPRSVGASRSEQDHATTLMGHVTVLIAGLGNYVK